MPRAQSVTCFLLELMLLSVSGSGMSIISTLGKCLEHSILLISWCVLITPEYYTIKGFVINMHLGSFQVIGRTSL